VIRAQSRGREVPGTWKTDRAGDVKRPPAHCFLPRTRTSPAPATTTTPYAIFEQDDLKRKHDQFSGARWGVAESD
jgi:hypothetical protein